MSVESERKRLARRSEEAIALANHIVPKRLQKTPSQKKSEAGRKKYLVRAGIQKQKEVYPSDCRDCQDEPTCMFGRNLEKCPKHSLVVVCQGCGQKVRIRVVLGKDWKHCPVCRVKA